MKVTKEIRTEYFNATGNYGSDEDIIEWLLSEDIFILDTPIDRAEFNELTRHQEALKNLELGIENVETVGELLARIGEMDGDAEEESTRPTVAHYKQGEIEPIDFINSHGMNFNLGNAIKYVTRCNHKGTKKADLLKAIDYINFELERVDNDS